MDYHGWICGILTVGDRFAITVHIASALGYFSRERGLWMAQNIYILMA